MLVEITVWHRVTVTIKWIVLKSSPAMRKIKFILTKVRDETRKLMSLGSFRFQSGFTLIEVLVAAIIIGVISGSGIAAYRRLNERATVDGTAKLVEQSLRDAQKRATAGVKPDDCQGSLLGYTITMNNDTYSIQADCSISDPPADSFELTDGTKFPVTKTVSFRVLARGAELEGGAVEDTIYVSNIDESMIYGIRVTGGGAVSGLGGSVTIVTPTPTSPVPPTLTPTPTAEVTPPPTPTPTTTPSPSPTPTPTISGAPWWNAGYSYRAKIYIYPGSDDVPNSFTQYLEINHYLLVNSGKARSDGRDVRIVYWNGSSWQELDRILDPTFANNNWHQNDTRLLFRLLYPIDRSVIEDQYYLYYGNSSSGTPPESENNVWRYYNDLNNTSGLDRFGSQCLGSMGTQVGRLSFTSVGSANPGCGVYDSNAPSLSNVELLADVEVSQDSNLNARTGVIFREQSNHSGYVVRIKPNGDDWRIGSIDADTTWTTGLQEGMGSSYGNKYRFRVRAIGSGIEWWFRTQSGSYQSSSQSCTAGSGSCSGITSGFSSGKFGFWNEKSQAGNFYDDLRVRLALNSEPISFLGTEEIVSP